MSIKYTFVNKRTSGIIKLMAKPTEAIISNRRAFHDYQIHDEYSVGIALSGREVKAVRTGRVSLKGSYVTIKDGELWLINASFSVIHTEPGQSNVSVDSRPRKLLAKTKEITQIKTAKDQGMTIVPLSMTTRTRYLKVKIATAKGKKLHDKRASIKQRDIERENARSFK